MQPANDKTVLGDFNNTRFTHFGVTSRFFKKDGRFMVNTQGPDGKPHDYTIQYTFGVTPLQQYLIEFPGGRLQALSLAWDTRPRAEGGQRWFHLYPDEEINHENELHWTGPAQNWNGMCAECHSTHLEKGYDPQTRSFATTWSEIDVSCEACHGPGLKHVSWARGFNKNEHPDQGLAVRLDERRGVQWHIDSETGKPSRSEPRRGDKEIEMCARCHARRSPITQGFVHGTPLLDHYRPRRLDEGLYHADGQIDDEVYVYGSFMQSRMYHAGVTCSDCHEPHSLALRAPGNAVCLQCHQAAKYDRPSHHFHKADSEGARCAECHMPPKTYMVVDPRHDHSMRIPRPDLSVRFNTPNACTHCHDKDPQWAARQVKAWYAHRPDGFQTYTPALEAARAGRPGAAEALSGLIRDTRAPAIARATALGLVGPYLNGENLTLLNLGLEHESPLLREAALGALDYVPEQIRPALALPLLNDPVRAVRIEAARVLAPVPRKHLTADQQARIEQGLEEYIAAQGAMAERPAAQTNLGNLYGMRGAVSKAVTAYNTAIELNPAYAPAYINLADLYRLNTQEAQAEAVLRRATERVRGNGDAHHALGLSLVRQKRMTEAISELERAATLDPGNVRYAYVYAVALNANGQAAQAITVLQTALGTHPGHPDILRALVAFHRDMGNLEAANTYARQLRTVPPR